MVYGVEVETKSKQGVASWQPGEFLQEPKPFHASFYCCSASSFCFVFFFLFCLYFCFCITLCCSFFFCEEDTAENSELYDLKQKLATVSKNEREAGGSEKTVQLHQRDTDCR